MSRESTIEKIFVGTHPRTMDTKNRVSVPAEWDMNPKEILYLLPSRDRAFINAMPRAELTRKEDELRAEVPPKHLRRIFRRTFGRVHEATIDPQGRIRIPDEFCAAVGLTNAISFVGMKNSIEIWDTAKVNLDDDDDDYSAETDEIIDRLGL